MEVVSVLNVMFCVLCNSDPYTQAIGVGDRFSVGSTLETAIIPECDMFGLLQYAYTVLVQEIVFQN